ncbi:uncharacterized protein G2W53_012254 [Senna tora]|uniref:Uncharacterized protein n=1 Tax=Senna tora TaxID=362788 RepID=A0A834U0E6_9FABA|nr:uncharacterized protein G2W53_012254 [Senna tora]
MGVMMGVNLSGKPGSFTRLKKKGNGRVWKHAGRWHPCPLQIKHFEWIPTPLQPYV